MENDGEQHWGHGIRDTCASGRSRWGSDHVKDVVCDIAFTRTGSSNESALDQWAVVSDRS